MKIVFVQDNILVLWLNINILLGRRVFFMKESISSYFGIPDSYGIYALNYKERLV